MKKPRPHGRGLSARPTGLEPVTTRLTVECSAVELWGKATNEYYIRRVSTLSNQGAICNQCHKKGGAISNLRQLDSVGSWTLRGPSAENHILQNYRTKEINLVFKETVSKRSKL